MKALVLAAGSSTRLRPLTDTLPKALLEIGGKALIDHQLEALTAAGVEEVVIVVGFQKEKLMIHIDAQKYPLRISYIHNDAYQTTGPILGGLLPAFEHIEGPVIFFHCDVLFGVEALRALLASNAESAMLVRKGAWDEEAGKVVFDAQNVVRELGKHIPKERASGEYLQVAKFSSAFCTRLRAVVEERARKAQDGYTIDAFNDAVAAGAVAMAVAYDGPEMEIDTPEDYAAAQAAWKE